MSHIVRMPLINPVMQVSGYKLAWHQDDKISGDPHAEILPFLTEALVTSDNTWRLAEKLLFLPVTPKSLPVESLQSFPPERMVLSMDAASLQDVGTLASVMKLRAQGFGLSLGNTMHASIEDEAMRNATHFEIDFSQSNFHVAVQARELRKVFPHARIVGKNIHTWEDYTASLPYRLDASSGKFYLEFHASDQGNTLNPTQNVILRALDLLNKNADVGLVEKELKSDPAMPYKLLRYINTAGFGGRFDISSLHQAINYIGYSSLSKWLCLTLAKSSTVPNASVLLETAMVRGSFLELLGRKRMTKNEADQLFITGIFSLLDRLLNMQMEAVLAEIRLSEAIQGALLGRTGNFGRYLSLVELCEQEHDSVASLADSLRISPGTINAAHLRAMIWAQQMRS